MIHWIRSSFLSSSTEMASERSLVWMFIVVGGWDWGRNSCPKPGACVAGISCHLQSGGPRLLIRLGHKGKKKVLKRNNRPLKESYDKPRQCIKKQRHHFAKKGLYSQKLRLFQQYGCENWATKKAERRRISPRNVILNQSELIFAFNLLASANEVISHRDFFFFFIEIFIIPQSKIIHSFHIPLAFYPSKPSIWTPLHSLDAMLSDSIT